MIPDNILNYFKNLDPVSVALGVGIGAILDYIVSLIFSPKGSGQINPGIDKSSAKVATMCPLKDIEDTVKKSDKGVVAYCRCWRSRSSRIVMVLMLPIIRRRGIIQVLWLLRSDCVS